jgi:hypothetical protein
MRSQENELKVKEWVEEVREKGIGGRRVKYNDRRRI